MAELGLNAMDSVRHGCRLSAEFSAMDALLHSLHVVWEAFLPFAVLWWNVMLYATCAKYFSWRRFRFCSTSGLRAIVSPGCPSLTDDISVASKTRDWSAEDAECSKIDSPSSPFEDGTTKPFLLKALDPCAIEDVASSSASFTFENGETEEVHLRAPVPCNFEDAISSSSASFACESQDTEFPSSDSGSCPFASASTALIAYLFEDSEASTCTYPFIEISPLTASTASRFEDNVASTSTETSLSIAALPFRYGEVKSPSDTCQFTNVSSSATLGPWKYEEFKAHSDKFPLEVTDSLCETTSTDFDKHQTSQADFLKANLPEELNIRYPCYEHEPETATVSSRMKPMALIACSSLPRNVSHTFAGGDYPFLSVDGFRPQNNIWSGLSLMDFPLVELRDNMKDFPLVELMDSMLHIRKPLVSDQEFLISWLSPKTFEWIRQDLLGRISDAELAWTFLKFQAEAAKDHGLWADPSSFTKNFIGGVNIADNLNSFPRLGFRPEQHRNLDQELCLNSDSGNRVNESIETKSVDQLYFASNISDVITPAADSVEDIEEEQHCFDPICSLKLNSEVLSGNIASCRLISLNSNDQDEYESDCSSITMDQNCADVRDQNFEGETDSFLTGSIENTYINSNPFCDSDNAISDLDDLYPGRDDVDEEEGMFLDENDVMCDSEEYNDDNGNGGQQLETWWDEDAILLSKQEEEDSLGHEWMLV